MRVGMVAKCLAGGAFGLLISGIAESAPLISGNVLLPVEARVVPTTGTVVETSSVPFSVPGAFSGTLTTTVVKDDLSNPYYDGTGRLTFTYLLENDGVAGQHAVGRMTIPGFEGKLTDVSYGSDSIGVAPAFADRSNSNVVGFGFTKLTGLDPRTGFLSPGTNSALLVIQTDSTTAVLTSASVIDGVGTSVQTYAAVAPPPVPEPATLGLLGAGALGLLLRRRR